MQENKKWVFIINPEDMERINYAVNVLRDAIKHGDDHLETRTALKGLLRVMPELVALPKEEPRE